MKPKLSFLGWQVCSTIPGRGLALFNEPSGSTISLQTAAQRFPNGFEIVAHVVIVSSMGRGIEFLAERTEGFEISGDMADAWIFDAERPYNTKLAATMISRVKLLRGEGAAGMIVSLSDAVAVMQARGIRGAEIGNFFARESTIPA